MKNLKFNNVNASLILNNENVKIETLRDQKLIIEYFNFNETLRSTNIYFNVCDTFIYNENDELIALKIVENVIDDETRSKIIDCNENVIYMQQLTNNSRDMLINFLRCKTIEKYDENHEQSNKIIIENFEKLRDFFIDDEIYFDPGQYQIYNVDNIIANNYFEHLLHYVARYKINANLFDIFYITPEIYENKYQLYLTSWKNNTIDCHVYDFHVDMKTLSFDVKQIFVNICL